ncbi:hypothetical protein BATDEDRAFT_91019 [Batrachochytrium dendrobatidis JAM81]|uniref:Uncharacterized protein n=2 Tax=Batrachochytrium dendrobatidis TaxID=109871 RepID=F4P9H7_BATDJ|nr:uncharacterized protein BATDEDRAFT_91019 [Batrachochytrium dendrobatidis JAM81]EGF78156.1 hypothetical protein BATDEDRAFT_91019 [Batrachochytrium dendrobatidis JAM81]OAJ32753.1 hypothetical protein BDEG_28637 [Batrachochytrium dendrobatidis JEL423]|eukprot:XP_006681218.1 hypothetical protein BATDEDRAFT_91019 [Batrachochytrium dendrobatidis JAM81]
MQNAPVSQSQSKTHILETLKDKKVKLTKDPPKAFYLASKITNLSTKSDCSKANVNLFSNNAPALKQRELSRRTNLRLKFSCFKSIDSEKPFIPHLTPFTIAPRLLSTLEDNPYRKRLQREIDEAFQDIISSAICLKK